MMDNNDNDNGMITKIWGPHAWFLLHSISFCYPTNPTYKDKQNFKKFFELLGEVLPCSYCKESYKNFINEGVTKLDDSVMENQTTLTKWLYYIHEAVNDKLGVTYDVSYDDVVNRYETYRASCKHNKEEVKNENIKGCDASTKKKMMSYKVANNKECPVIPIKMAKHFIKYAKIRGLNIEHFDIINNVSDNCKENNKLWEKRNAECYDIYNNMRLYGINSLENEGNFKGLPTIDELKLILRLSSNLNKDNLIDIIKKLQNLPGCKCEYSKIYKLVK